MPHLRLRTFAILLALSATLTFAQAPQKEKKSQTQAAATPAQPNATTAHDLTTADLDAFFEGMIPAQIARQDIAGAVIAVVKDGKVIYERGYGYADVKSKKPVTEDATLFRPGSITKLFTWTAVMQLVEQGKLDLDTDVNTYLDFKIPPKFGKPITLRNIMTHTPGFEESVKDLIQKDTAVMPLRDYLTQHMPERIFPPGRYGAYSNYATSVAGYIVQRVSGEKYEDYIAHHIFAPLGMAHSTMVQPLPANLKDLMSSGYDKASDDKAQAFELIPASPAGALSTTADDMTRFMIAHLNLGSYNGAQILKPATAQLMHAAQWSPGPGLHSMCLGFYEESRNGYRIIGHGGDTDWFHSDLHLIPAAHVGLFISYNSAGKGGNGDGRSVVLRQFMDRYFPYSLPPVPAYGEAKADAKAVAGEYMSTRRSQTNILWMTALLGENKVSASADGTLTVDDMKSPNGKPWKWTEVAPMQYRQTDAQGRIAFTTHADGTKVMGIDFPAVEYQRVPWYQRKSLNAVLFYFMIAVFVLTVALWPLASFIRRHYGTFLTLDRARCRRRRLVYLACLVDLVAAIYFFALLSNIDTAEALSDPKLDLKLRILQLIILAGVLGTIMPLINLFRPWWEGLPVRSIGAPAPQRWWVMRAHDLLIAVACLGFCWFAIYWKLLVVSLKF